MFNKLLSTIILAIVIFAHGAVSQNLLSYCGTATPLCTPPLVCCHFPPESGVPIGFDE
ncbi:hypothetical protein C8R44DRAFT_886085 [Mycena epipterygia]|nr:hypothetical protein C8R44DRAFT_886085 [Mycena epipterygia]